MTDLEEVPPSVAVSTSEDAADAVRPHLTRLRAVVLRWLVTTPLTCDQLETATGLAHQTVGPRLRELADRGLIRRTPERRLTRTGRTAFVWAPTALGEQIVAEYDARADAAAA